MSYLENIWVCISVPFFLALLFMKGKERRYLLFSLCGMTSCLLASYVTSFFMGYCGADAYTSTVEITPVCEEILKMLPFLLWLIVFEPKEEIMAPLIWSAVGFATFENICYLAENGAENFYFLLIRGVSAGTMHLFCGIIAGYGVTFVFCRSWIRWVGMAGILGFCIIFHGMYNLLVMEGGNWQKAGYLFPICLIAVVYISRRMKNHIMKMIPD